MNVGGQAKRQRRGGSARATFVAAAAVAMCWAAAVPSRASAAEAKLGVGDAAPALRTGRWLKGDPVRAFEPGRIYVLVFWSRYSGPSRQVLPMLSDLQKAYADKGVVVIAQHAGEEDEDELAAFVLDMGDRMAYRVAADDYLDAPRGAMATAWLDAAGVTAIPTTFVVGKDGKVAWLGQPRDVEPVVQSILDGTYDANTAKRQVAAAADDHDALVKFDRKLNGLLKKGDWDGALAAAEEMAAQRPSTMRSMGLLRFNILLQAKKDYDAAYRVADELARALPDDEQVHNDLAWTIADTPGLEKRDLDLALRLATRANEIMKGENGAVLDTLARCYWEKGDKAKAIELQEKALEKVEPERRADLQAVLDRYRAAK